MDQEERKDDFGTWLRRAWSAALRTVEAMERSPVELLLDRIERLEREVAALKQEDVDRSDQKDHHMRGGAVFHG